MIRFPFGIHKGERLDDMPEEYFLWAADLPDIRPTLRYAIHQ